MFPRNKSDPRKFFDNYLLKKHSLKIPKNETLAIASIFAKGINDKTIVNSFLDLTKKEKEKLKGIANDLKNKLKRFGIE